jgi:hypothetical protein
MELRVHGVGGSSVDGMLVGELGEDALEDRPTVAWRSEAGARSAVYRRQSLPGVFAYHWAPLTSGSRWFALWPLLLPFTLSNVVGFMAPQGSSWRRVVLRALAATQAVVLTALTAWWAIAAAWLALNRVDLPDWLPLDARVDPVTPDGGAVAPTAWVDTADEQRTLAAVVVGGLVIAVLVLAATYSSDGFERYRRRTWTERRSWVPWRPREFRDLSDPQFFDNGRAHVTRWVLHLLVAVGAGATAVVWIVRGDGGMAHPTRELGWLVVVGAAVSVALALLVLLNAAIDPATWKAGDRAWCWRMLPATATVAAPALLGGMVLTACLWRIDVAELPAGPLVVLYDAYGWAVGVTVGVLAASLVGLLGTPVPAESIAPPHRALPTLGGRLSARLARALGLSDVVLGSFAVSYVIAAAAGFVLRREDLDEYRLTESVSVQLARATFLVLLGFLVLNLVRSKASAPALRRVGTIWDVVTFWPRTFHPFAVRSYAERAVPELQDLLDGASSDQPLHVVAHSQGTVLVFAALAPSLKDAPSGARPPQWSCVSVGSPLRTLYARAFPYYFSPDHFGDARTRLRWTNVFRFTDYIGRSVFATDLEVAGTAPPAQGADDPGDVWVVDPATDGQALNRHSGYWNDVEVAKRLRTYTHPGPGGTP